MAHDVVEVVDVVDVIIALWVLWACVLPALAFPANTANAAQTAIPVSNDFVMIVPSFRCNAAKAMLRLDATAQLLHLK
jgi:hypothetical protein